VTGYSIAGFNKDWFSGRGYAARESKRALWLQQTAKRPRSNDA
jgi:hypothetical protein